MRKWRRNKIIRILGKPVDDRFKNKSKVNSLKQNHLPLSQSNPPQPPPKLHPPQNPKKGQIHQKACFIKVNEVSRRNVSETIPTQLLHRYKVRRTFYVE